jgi:hypothetical protein
MTEIDPNLFVSLAQSYMGGVTLPKPAEAGYRVFVNDAGTNFRYSPGEVDSLPAFSAPNAYQHLRVSADGSATEWHTLLPATIGAAAAEDLTAHLADLDNPHDVTPAQLGVLTAAEVAAAYLPLAGGTVTGKVTGPAFAGTQTTSVLVNGTATINSCNVKIDTEGEAATDDWDGVLFGPNVPDGSLILVRSVNSSRDTTIKNQGTPTSGSGLIYCNDNRDHTIAAAGAQCLVFVRQGAHLTLIGGFSGFGATPTTLFKDVEASGAITAASVAATGAVSGATVAATGALSTAARLAITASAVPATPATGVSLYWTGTGLAFKDAAGAVHLINSTPV